MSNEQRIERKAATEFAQKRDRIMGFIHSAKELQPLLADIQVNSEGDSESYMIELTEIVQKHNRSLEMLIDSFNLDQSVPSDSLLITLLGVELSKIERSMSFPEGAGALIKEIANTLTQNTVRRKDLTELQKDIAFNSDIVACVKTSLFRSAFEFSNLLDALRATEQEKQGWLKWFHSTSVALGKDVAFNFDQHGTFRDREMLFRECLPICTNLVVSTWKSRFVAQIIKQTDGAFSGIALEPAMLVYGMKNLEENLNNRNMGYQNHKTTDLNWLKKQISYSIYGISESYDLSYFDESDSVKIKELILSELEKLSIVAWDNASELTIEKIKEKVSSMTHEQKIEWKKKEGANPMPFSAFKEELKRLWNGQCSLLSRVELTEEELTTATRGALAHLWGYSDAFCRVKKDTLK